jgi:hypothetical protein
LFDAFAAAVLQIMQRIVIMAGFFMLLVMVCLMMLTGPTHSGLTGTTALTGLTGMAGMTPIDGSSGAPWQRTQAVSTTASVVPCNCLIVTSCMLHMQLEEVGDGL